MITFKQFLVESRSAPLYHGTPPGKNLQNIIINREGIKPKTIHMSHKMGGTSNMITKPHLFQPQLEVKVAKGVSTSRSFDFASKWGDVVLELDQRVISQKYKIGPFNFFRGQVTIKREQNIT